MQVSYPGMQLRIVPVTPFRQNCSILWHEQTGRCIMVDVGGDAICCWTLWTANP